jgi:endoglucanase
VALLVDPNFGAVAQPFKILTIPGTINAVDYDIGNEGVSYHDAVSKVTVYQGAASNTGWAYRNDGVDIEASADAEGFSYDVGWIEDGEWLSYTVNIAQAPGYQAGLRVASATGGGILRLLVDGVSAGQDLGVASTGGWQFWRTLTLSNLKLPAGQHTLKLLAVKGGFNVDTLAFRTME